MARPGRALSMVVGGGMRLGHQNQCILSTANPEIFSNICLSCQKLFNLFAQTVVHIPSLLYTRARLLSLSSKFILENK